MQNESYRRCACSSRLVDIQNKERALSQSATQLQDFKDLNIDVISKTADEVTAMITAAEGEMAAENARDKSASAQQLAGISAVLSSTKTQSKAESSNVDIAGDIDAIWSTTDFTAAADLANLTGEALYNAVHAQCVELVRENCNSDTTLNMAVSAYGMYIENDCSALLTALDKQLNTANATIRTTEREMQTARLENYDAHNSVGIHDCIAQVRTDMAADNACGENYVHCLDITGRYLNYNTGEPIYTADFYQLQHQISLSGDVLTNPTNATLVAALDNKRGYAERGLDKCRDLADEVWDEYIRQTITQIYQAQQVRIRKVKDECLDVVNTCYDEQNKSLRDFSNAKEQLLLGSQMELSEDMCRVKLDTCSNLYGDGAGNGLELLVAAMRAITDQTIGKQCHATLLEYVADMCAVPSTDTIHAYPYGCRVYAPGDAIYAAYPTCNNNTTKIDQVNPFSDGGTDYPGLTEILAYAPPAYMCPALIQYRYCRSGYYLRYCDTATGKCTHPSDNIKTKYGKDLTSDNKADQDACYPSFTVSGANPDGTNVCRIQAGNECAPCPEGYHCDGGIAAATRITSEGEYWNKVNQTTTVCGDDYIGSLYQKLVRYATEACVRPSDTEDPYYVLPPDILSDVNSVMDTLRAQIAQSLSTECERLGGVWVSTPTTADDETLYPEFYAETSANTKWGYCKQP